MSMQAPAPLAGLLRVVFFLAVASMAIATVVTGVGTLYDPPEEEGPNFNEGFGEFDFDSDGFGLESEEKRDYDRNVGLTLGLLGTAVIAVSVLALGPRQNPLRAGLLAGGVGLVLWGVGTGIDASDDWLVFLTSGLALFTLLVCSLWLDEGLPPQMLARRGPAGPPPGAGSGPSQPWQGSSGATPGPGG
ncbi:MAG: hypothetical protein WD379_03010 [Dehalococcoidia bacterium]